MLPPPAKSWKKCREAAAQLAAGADAGRFATARGSASHPLGWLGAARLRLDCGPFVTGPERLFGAVVTIVLAFVSALTFIGPGSYRAALAELDCRPGEGVGVAMSYATRPSAPGEPNAILRQRLPNIPRSDVIVIRSQRAETRRFHIVRGGRVVIAGDMWGSENEGWFVHNVASCASR